MLPFVERECSIQRRHQKVVEESPSVAGRANPASHGRVRGARGQSVGTNAGTIEFLLDEDGKFFLEMNTRLQDRASRDGAVTGSISCSGSFASPWVSAHDPAGARLTPVAHAIECRIYAEDPDAGFLRAPARARALDSRRPGVRDDRGVAPASTSQCSTTR